LSLPQKFHSKLSVSETLRNANRFVVTAFLGSTQTSQVTLNSYSSEPETEIRSAKVPQVFHWWNDFLTNKLFSSISETHCASVVARVTKDSTRALGRHSKNSFQYRSPAVYSWRPHDAPAMHLGRELGSAVFFFSWGFYATPKRQSCNKVVIGNWNITSLTGKEHGSRKTNDIP